MVNKSPFISVLLPCYNAEKFIKKCIWSILKQTYSNFELIVSDDCSKDNTIKIVKELVKYDNRIRLLTSDKNQGIAFQRKKLISESKGEYFIFIDADDLFAKKILEKLIKPIVKNGIDYDFITCKSVFRFQNKKEKVIIKAPIFYNNLILPHSKSNKLKFIRNNLTVTIWGCLIRKEYFTSLDFNFSDFRNFEDVGCTIILVLKAKHFYAVNYYGYYYVKNKTHNNISSLEHFSYKNINDFVWQITKIIEYLVKEGYFFNKKYFKTIQLWFYPLFVYLAFIEKRTLKNIDSKEDKNKIKIFFTKKRMEMLYIIFYKYHAWFFPGFYGSWWKFFASLVTSSYFTKELKYIKKWK